MLGGDIPHTPSMLNKANAHFLDFVLEVSLGPVWDDSVSFPFVGFEERGWSFLGLSFSFCLVLPVTAEHLDHSIRNTAHSLKF